VSIFVDELVHEFGHKGYTFGVREISYGESNQINKKAMTINMVTKKPEIDLAVLQEEKIKASLSFIKDSAGNETAVTLEVIRKFKDETAQKILEEIEKISEVSEEEKKN
jgi:hypothetical protein